MLTYSASVWAVRKHLFELRILFAVPSRDLGETGCMCGNKKKTTETTERKKKKKIRAK